MRPSCLRARPTMLPNVLGGVDGVIQTARSQILARVVIKYAAIAFKRIDQEAIDRVLARRQAGRLADGECALQITGASGRG